LADPVTKTFFRFASLGTKNSDKLQAHHQCFSGEIQMKFKSLLLVVGFIPTMAMAMDKHSVTGTKPPQQVGGAVPGPKPPAPVTIKPSPPPNQQPKNNVGGPQGVQGPQQQAGGVKNQPNNLLSGGEKPLAPAPKLQMNNCGDQKCPVEKEKPKS
jgi:hypothetical protein